MTDDIGKPGTKCTLNAQGDLFFERESHEFIGADCVVVKRTKAGLIMVALENDRKRTYSVPQRNVDLRT